MVLRSSQDACALGVGPTSPTSEDLRGCLKSIFGTDAWPSIQQPMLFLLPIEFNWIPCGAYSGAVSSKALVIAISEGELGAVRVAMSREGTSLKKLLPKSSASKLFPSLQLASLFQPISIAHRHAFSLSEYIGRLSAHLMFTPYSVPIQGLAPVLRADFDARISVVYWNHRISGC